jgi:hypothetical protein
MAGDPSPLPPQEIEAAVRRYLARLAVRYVPLVVALVVLALVVALVPRADQAGKRTAAAGAGSQSLPAADGTQGSASGAGASTGGPGGGGPAGSAGPRQSAARAVAVPTGITPPAAAGSVGVTRSGVTCGPGVRQVVWSRYAPLCVPAYKGNNGGTTSHGVTADTVKISFRLGNSTEDKAVYAAAGAAAPAPDPDIVADMQAYVDYFNRQYELYGRKVVLESYQGQGDYIQEDQGQGQAGAAADAVTAHDKGAFGDATFNLKGSNPYWANLAQQKVIAFGPLGFPQSYYERYAPYWYTPRPTGEKQAQFLVNLVCRRMAGMPAIFAGDATYKTKTRVFGLVTPENPEYMLLGDQIESGLQRCGVKLARRVNYAINVAQFGGQATSMVAQLRAAGVTTTLCYCDPLIPIFITQSADQQQYQPEWYEPYYRDPQGRLESQQQWAHALSNGGTSYTRPNSEAYRVFKLAQPNGEPKTTDQYFDVSYEALLQIFNALQAAGPNLTPETLRRGMFSLPTSATGDLGTWSFGPGSYSPSIDNQLGYWDPNAASPWDGKKGAWVSCEGGTWLQFARPETFGPEHTQPHCFGR